MRCLLNVLFKEYRNKRLKDTMKTKLTETTLTSPTKDLFIYIVLKLICRYHNTLAAGLKKKQSEMGVILRVKDVEILIFFIRCHSVALLATISNFYQNLLVEVLLFLKTDNFEVKAFKN